MSVAANPPEVNDQKWATGTCWPEVRADQLAQVRVMPYPDVPVNGAQRAGLETGPRTDAWQLVYSTYEPSSAPTPRP